MNYQEDSICCLWTLLVLSLQTSEIAILSYRSDIQNEKQAI